MNQLFKLKIIFAYYVTENFTELHRWHLLNFNNVLMNNNCISFDDINIYLLVDNNNINLIDTTKEQILSYINNKFSINFYVIENNPIYREGLIYKTEIIDKLD